MKILINSVVCSILIIISTMILLKHLYFFMGYVYVIFWFLLIKFNLNSTLKCSYRTVNKDNLVKIILKNTLSIFFVNTSSSLIMNFIHKKNIGYSNFDDVVKILIINVLFNSFAILFIEIFWNKKEISDLK